MNIERVYNILKDKDITGTTEEYLFRFEVNFHHLLSLCWTKADRASTPNYKVFLVSECLKNLVCASILSDISVDNINTFIDDAYNEIKKIGASEFDTWITAFNGETRMEIDAMGKFALVWHFVQSITGCEWSEVENSQKFDI